MNLFLDLDGVLVDFDRGYEQLSGLAPEKKNDDVDWDLVNKTPAFYARLPPTPDAFLLWDFCKPYSPAILTGIPESVRTAEADKRKWVAKYLGAGVTVLCCASKDKCQFGRPGRILVDDWEKYRDKWLATGGAWITHTDAVSTIAALRALGFSG